MIGGGGGGCSRIQVQLQKMQIKHIFKQILSVLEELSKYGYVISTTQLDPMKNGQQRPNYLFVS